MSVGDLVKWYHPALNDNEIVSGIVIEAIGTDLVSVMWQDGSVTKEWRYEVDLINECR